MFEDEALRLFASQHSGAGAKALRQAYGIYKLITAPREALRLGAARADRSLGRLIAGAGRKRALASQPFICSKWSCAMRLRRMIDHCAIVDELGHPFTIDRSHYIEILTFELDGEPCRLMLDQPGWLASDGLLCVSLWQGAVRVFSISFCLSTSPSGRIAYVGGIQGQRSAAALEHNRMLTKAAHGLRPRDLAFELFRMLLPAMGVTQLECVADAHRYQMTRRARITIRWNDKVQLDYDETWESRGGLRGNNGFFRVPIAYARRDISEIPSKKRAMYKKRYALLDDLQLGITTAMQGTLSIQVHDSAR